MQCISSHRVAYNAWRGRDNEVDYLYSSLTHSNLVRISVAFAICQFVFRFLVKMNKIPIPSLVYKLFRESFWIFFSLSLASHFNCFRLNWNIYRRETQFHEKFIKFIHIVNEANACLEAEVGIKRRLPWKIFDSMNWMNVVEIKNCCSHK